MSVEEAAGLSTRKASRWAPIIAIVLALTGLGDSIYLTVHHYTAEPVPCSLTNGCEMVLTSAWSTVAGIPLSLLGAVAYFVAFSLALFALFGDRRLWAIFGIQAAFMAAFSGWLLYVQGALIGEYCQFCLLSAATSASLFVVYILSLFLTRQSVSR